MSSGSGRAVQPTKTHAALRPYRRAGFDLIPLHKPNATRTKPDGTTVKLGKTPRDKGWRVVSYQTKRVIADAVATGRNVGVRLGASHLVIDVDPRHGGSDGFLNLCFDFGLDDSAWPCVITGGGGLHFYLGKPADRPVLNTLRDYPGVEFKSLGRQVVAAGSTHPDTLKRYRWDRKHPALTGDLPLAPAALLDAIQRPDRASTGTAGGEYDADAVAMMLAGLDPADYREHESWLRVMMACHHASGGDARAEFVAWSTADPQYSDAADVIEARWDSLHKERNDGVTAATLFHELREHGRADLIPPNDPQGEFEAVEDDDDDASWLEGGGDASPALAMPDKNGLVLTNRNVAFDDYRNALTAVSKSGLSPRWNDLKQSVEFCGDSIPWGKSYGHTLNDHTLRLARLFLATKYEGVAYQPSENHLFEALMTLAYGAKFNPVTDWLDGLAWDGTPRAEHLFSRYFGCADSPYTRAVSRCFLVGAVRRQRQPGVRFDTMPVLKSPQGYGKSTGIEALFGKPWYSDSDMGGLRDKDAMLKLRGIWVIEFAEVESLTRHEAGTLKAFTSRAVDRLRDPYDRMIRDVPRRCVFVATVNESGYLKDSTGARRFWPLNVERRIDIAGIIRDRDQLFAEAAAMEARGDSLVLPRELWRDAARRQEAETADDPWADKIREFLDARAVEAALTHDGEDGVDEPPPPPDKVFSFELFDALGVRAEAMTKDKAQRLRTVMEAVLGWQHKSNIRVHGRVRKGYIKPDA